jgi:hypothetical protein
MSLTSTRIEQVVPTQQDQVDFKDAIEEIIAPEKQADIETLVAETALADGSISSEEWQAIFQATLNTFNCIGQSATAAKTIVFDLQNTTDNSCFPTEDDLLTLALIAASSHSKSTRSAKYSSV